ncbi:hypothetical protein HK104_008390 [Borealophlyctis nickersoniae]|nr:hypothetical protein HK104_008390 [Borealophlyctis nickersoniae]
MSLLEAIDPTAVPFVGDRETKERIRQQLIWKGTKVAAGVAAVSTGASLLANKYSQFYRSLPLAAKTGIILAITTETFYTYTNAKSIEIATRAADENPRNPEAREDYEFAPPPKDAIDPPMWRAIKRTLLEHRYSVIGALWTGLVGGSMLYELRTKRIAGGDRFKVTDAKLLAACSCCVGSYGR